MPTKILRAPEHVTALVLLLSGRKLPLTVSWTQGAPLSDKQRNLSFRWYQDISRQLGDRTPGEARAECKVSFAAPILCEAMPDFAALWADLRGAFGYEKLLKFVERSELPMTSLMSVAQMTAYMDAVQREYAGQGVRLTDPEALKYEMEFQ
jgi:hypothetical protein